jgi:hypothetical protein
MKFTLLKLKILGQTSYFTLTYKADNLHKYYLKATHNTT